MLKCVKKINWQCQSLEVLTHCAKKMSLPEFSLLSLHSLLSCQWQHLLEPLVRGGLCQSWYFTIPVQPIQPTTKDILLKLLAIPAYTFSDNFLCYFLNTMSVYILHELWAPWSRKCEHFALWVPWCKELCPRTWKMFNQCLLNVWTQQ